MDVENSLQPEAQDSFPLLTVIVPIFNEAETIPLFFARILPVLNQLQNYYATNILFLNNASTDNSYNLIAELHNRYPYVYLISMSSNVGYQKSIECGFRNAKGDIFVVIDVDCEDPPEMIIEFIQQYEKGFDLVYGLRNDRTENVLIKSFRKLFYQIVYRVADDDVILYMAEFSLLTSEVRDAIIDSLDSFPFLRSSMSRVGFNRVGIPYKRQSRIAGETHYNFYTMTVFAIASILSATTLPLRLPIYLLPPWVISTLILFWAFFASHNYGFLLGAIFLSCTYIGGTISAISLYLARTYRNSLRRPNSFIHKRYSFMQED